MKHKFDDFIDDLRTAHGKNLASVILYGSAATGEFVDQQSDYNLLVALHNITPKDLRAAQAPMREWSKLGHAVPVYFTVDELKTAADVFPIEFNNMERARKVLYGDDVLKDIVISNQFLRHQTEYELRSKLIMLRRQYIPASISVENLTKLMSDSLGSFATLFRAVLMLHELKVPISKRELIAYTAASLKIDGKPFEKILNIRENNFAYPLDEISANELFADYIKQIESIIEAVDNLQTA